MKSLLLSIVLFITVTFTYAQTSLIKSRESGYKTYIYRLSDQECFVIASKSKAYINDSFLHTLVDSFYYDNHAKYKGKLPYGNYLYVTPVKNQLVYNLETVQNVRLNFINDLKNVQFAITDLKGEEITGAVVEIGKGKSVKYDQQAHLYLTRSAPKEKVIKVSYQNVSNYFNFNDQPNRYVFRGKKHYDIPQKDKKIKQDYKGYMVFNKPLYKPLDTVKFKSYLLTAKGQVIKERELRVELCSSYQTDGKVISVIKPYRDGGYNLDFVLADSLGLKLDDQYSVVLKEFTGAVWKEVYRGSFRYEDYEFKSISFFARTDKEEYNPGSPVTVYLSAKDENGLAVPDGRVLVKAFANNSFNYRSNTVFVPDSLWKTEIKLDPIGETKLVLPDSIFPKADLNFSLGFEFLNSNNERQTSSKYLRYVYRSAKIKSSLKKDSLNFVYLVNGKPLPQKVKLVSYAGVNEKLDSVETALPLQLKINPAVTGYTIETKDGYKEDVQLGSLSPSVDILSSHTKDSLQIRVNNPQKIPFWYTVFSGDQIIWKGYTTSLDTVIRHSGNQAAHVRVNYVWAGLPFQTEVSAAYQPGQLNVKFKGPETVYPGQQVKMEVELTGADEKPVPFTDVTAYAMTSKFKNIPYVNLPDFNKGYTLRKQSPQIEKVDLKADGGLMINWNKWGKTLGLDTIAYYQFTHPAALYTIAENVKDSLTQVAPFVAKDGEIQAVHVVYIDEIPVFFSKTDQLQHYSFPVSPGKHNIRLRTLNQMISLADITIANGKKTILSVNADVKNPLAKVIEAPEELTDYESELLSKYLLNIQNNFVEEKTILQAGKEEDLLNPLPFSFMFNNVNLVGPVAANYLTFLSGEIKQPFIKEPGYTYTFTKGLIKQRSNFTPYGFEKKLSEGLKKQSDNYREYAITKKDIDSLWDDYLNLRSYTTNLFNNYNNSEGASGQLRMEVDTVALKDMPYIKNILIYKSDQPEYGKIYPGNTTYYSPLAKGTYRIMYLFKDNRYFIEEGVAIGSGGLNYFKWKTLQIRKADAFSTKIDASIKSVRIYTPSAEHSPETRVSEVFNEEYFDRGLLQNKISGLVVDERKLPVAGATVRVKGLKDFAVTNIRGEFKLNAAAKGKIIINSIGFVAKEVEIKSGNLGVIILNADNSSLSEVAVVGYSSGSVRRDKVVLREVRTGPGDPSIIRLRGVASAPSGQKPLVIVDGLPFEGDMSQLNPNDIANMDVLKGEAATSVWGSRGAGGVIVIKTKKGNQVLNTAGVLVDQTQTLRNNFSDYAFWQPRLLTNEQGIASWTVKFPDDITSWTTRIIAMNGNKQSGQIETQIRSFKSLSANFVSPQFALEGDSINVIGKLMNYTPQEEKVTRKFSYNGQELRNNTLQFKNAHIDTIQVVAQGKDSLSFKYTLEQPNGYFDGELRKIPVLTTGVTETKGYFDVLEKDTTVNYNFQAGLGKVTLRAEASVFPVLLDEMEKLRKYEYLCNEQLASKLKSLLLEKSVRTYLGEPFKHEKEIRDIIKKLLGSKRKEGTWGWWQDSSEEMWISLHVVEALLKAEQQGYPIVMDRDLLYRYLVNKISDGHHVEQVKLIHLLNSKFFIKDMVKEIAAEQQKRSNTNVSLYEKLQLVQLQQMTGETIDLKWLMSIHKNTLFGSIYWGENNNLFWDNSIQNTLLAYQILKADGKHAHELEMVRRYFLEQRSSGQWRNTYESSLILETILPDLLAEGKRYEPASLVIDQKETIKDFPFTRVIDAAKPVSIAKKGKLPVYFTAYQQFVNPKPEKVSKDFTVSTSFSQEGITVKKLKAGMIAKLSVEVEAKSDGDYVMIEIPIPAGCSYENRAQRYWGPETHREYFKNKTSIFCTKLKAGKYNFEIELMPRYSGSYVLNPAKAELMYFPVFYGREGMKRVGIN